MTSQTLKGKKKSIPRWVYKKIKEVEETTDPVLKFFRGQKLSALLKQEGVLGKRP